MPGRPFCHLVGCYEYLKNDEGAGRHSMLGTRAPLTSLDQS